MFDQTRMPQDHPDAQAEAARLGALPDAPLAMPRQVLERAPWTLPFARLRALLAQRLDA